MSPLILISAWNDSGGAFVHRLFDGHPELACWPFELQLGTSASLDGFAGSYHLKYRWPVFANLDADPRELFDAVTDEELKGNLDRKNPGKFSRFQIEADLDEWRNTFVDLLSEHTYPGIISAYLRSFFLVWRNRVRSNEERFYLGHCPIIALDADRIFEDFPDTRIVHVVRSPFASLCDIRSRHPGVRADDYAKNWSMINGWAHVWSLKRPEQFRILHYPALLDQRELELRSLCDWLGIRYLDSLLTPSWNGTPIENIAPFGGVQAISREHESSSLDRLPPRDVETLERGTALVRDLLGLETKIHPAAPATIV